jgi:hypothetical protein
MAYKSWAKWNLFNVDTFDELEGQFPLENVSQTAGATYEEKWTLNQNEPIAQWIHGTVEEWTFNTKIRALNSTDDITSKIQWLINSIKKEDKLGRPPLYVWTWGSIEISCYIVNVNPVWDSLQPISIAGTTLPREVTFDITLRKYTPFDIKVTDPNAPFRDTYYISAKLGDTYESLAQRQYGNPMWGDFLRRRQPENPYLETGTIVPLLKVERFLEEANEPESPPMQRTEEALELRKQMFELRGGDKISYIL